MRDFLCWLDICGLGFPLDLVGELFRALNELQIGCQPKNRGENGCFPQNGGFISWKTLLCKHGMIWGFSHYFWKHPNPRNHGVKYGLFFFWGGGGGPVNKIIQV